MSGKCNNGFLNNTRINIWPFLVVAAAMFPVMLFRDFTPANELRYLSIADESIASGRLWAFMNHGVPYADKPPLYIWLIMLCRVVAGKHVMFLLSLFSLIPGLTTAAVMESWSRDFIESGYRNSFVLMLLTCGLFAGMCVFVRMDMLMTMFIVLALRQFCIIREKRQRATFFQRLLFPIYVFLAIFSKGPMGFLIPLVSTTVFLIYKREWKQWGRYWGWLTWGVLLLLCVSWFGSVFLEGGISYLDNLLVKQTVGRGVNSFHHKASVWYYLKTMPYTLLPWTPLIVASLIVMAIRRKEFLGNDLTEFFVTVTLSTFVMLSLISSKIQVYMLPVYPFLVALTMIVVSRQGWRRWSAAMVMFVVVVLALAGIGLLAVALSVQEFADRVWVWFLIIVLISGPTAAYIQLYIRRRIDHAVNAVALTLLATVFAGGFTIKEFNADLGYGRLTDVAREEFRKNENAGVYTLNLSRAENIDVYLGQKSFRQVDVEGIDRKRLEFPQGSVVMTRSKYAGCIKNPERVIKVGHRYCVVVTGKDLKNE